MEKEEFIADVEKATALTFFLLMALGIVQVVLGIGILKSVALTANGIDCMGDGFVSMVVWMGLKFFSKPADDKFHYGYYKIENIASMASAIVMMILAGYIIYRSYSQLVNPHIIKNPEIGALVALSAAIIAWGMGIKKFLKGKKSGLQSVKLDAINTIKDGTASFLAVVALILASKGYNIADSIAGFIIAGVIVSIGFASMKEAGYMLVDACDAECMFMAREIKSMAESMPGVKNVHTMRLRRAGPFLQGEIEIEVEAHMNIKEANRIREEILKMAKEKIKGLEKLSVIVVPHKNNEKEI